MNTQKIEPNGPKGKKGQADRSQAKDAKKSQQAAGNQRDGNDAQIGFSQPDADLSQGDSRRFQNPRAAGTNAPNEDGDRDPTTENEPIELPGARQDEIRTAETPDVTPSIEGDEVHSDPNLKTNRKDGAQGTVADDRANQLPSR